MRLPGFSQRFLVELFRHPKKGPFEPGSQAFSNHFQFSVNAFRHPKKGCGKLGSYQAGLQSHGFLYNQSYIKLPLVFKAFLHLQGRQHCICHISGPFLRKAHHASALKEAFSLSGSQGVKAQHFLWNFSCFSH